jgi:hypothetical protein
MRRNLLAAGLALLPTLAQAHGDIDGLNRFTAGALHPLLVPAHAVALLALALLIGQRGLASGHHALTVLLVALLAGLGAAATTVGQDLDLPVLIIGTACALAVVAARPVPPWLLWLVASLIGIGVGVGSAPDVADTTGRWTSVTGTALGAFLTVSLVAAVTDSLRQPWTRIGMRVVGSWLAASALLVLALAAATPATRHDQNTPMAGMSSAR